MKTNVFFLSALLCLSLGVGRAQAALEWDKKEVSVEVQRGAQADVRAQFAFKNRGKKTVTILGVSTSCGCTVADPESSTTSAGEKGCIYAVFTIGKQTGLQAKKIIISTDDPDSAQVVLTLKVNIVEPPPLPAAGPVKAGQAK